MLFSNCIIVLDFVLASLSVFSCCLRSFFCKGVESCCRLLRLFRDCFARFSLVTIVFGCF